MIQLLLDSGAHPDGGPDYEGEPPMLIALSRRDLNNALSPMHQAIALHLFYRGAQTAGIDRELLQPLFNALGRFSR
jgi:hypothetical protein